MKTIVTYLWTCPGIWRPRAGCRAESGYPLETLVDLEALRVRIAIGVAVEVGYPVDQIAVGIVSYSTAHTRVAVPEHWGRQIADDIAQFEADARP